MTAVQGFNPRTGEPFGDAVPSTSDAELDAIVAKAVASGWGAWPSTERAEALERVADALDAESELLVSTADSETALGVPRLSGELKRTTNQLRLFASVLREGSYLEATVDTADATTVPPRPELRRILRPIGPVGVFAASNFPFAFSVAGGDTASALAAGCPVVVKAHEAHPRTSEATARIVATALAKSGAPDGTFGIVFGPRVGGPLVAHPSIAAVGFTGSFAGGAALQAIAAGRDHPIPFYGELGSTNPVVVLPGAASNRAEQTAVGYAGSLTQGVGQFCTKPGLLFAPAGSPVCRSIVEAVSASRGGPLLTSRIKDAYESFSAWDGAPVAATGNASADAFAVAPELRSVDADHFAAHLDDLAIERFGPGGLLITYDSVDALLPVLARLPGSLAASIFADETSDEDTVRVASVLRRRAGRLIMNGWPTGVAVCAAQHHGGPWPAATDARYTSVGATAIDRWLVPVVFQNWPERLLPPELRSDNPLNVPQQVQA